jgi:hypothetical protein
VRYSIFFFRDAGRISRARKLCRSDGHLAKRQWERIGVSFEQTKRSLDLESMGHIDAFSPDLEINSKIEGGPLRSGVACFKRKIVTSISCRSKKNALSHCLENSEGCAHFMLKRLLQRVSPNPRTGSRTPMGGAVHACSARTPTCLKPDRTSCEPAEAPVHQFFFWLDPRSKVSCYQLALMLSYWSPSVL